MAEDKLKDRLLAEAERLDREAGEFRIRYERAADAAKKLFEAAEALEATEPVGPEAATALSRERTPPDLDDSETATAMRPDMVLAREPGGLVGDVAVYDRTTGELLRDPIPPPETSRTRIEYVERPRAPLGPPPPGNPPPVSRRAIAYLADRPGPTRSAAEVAEAIIIPGESLRKVKKAVSTALRSAADAGKVRRIEADGGVRYRYNRPATATEAEG